MRRVINTEKLPIPPHYSPENVGEIWKVDYQKRADEAIEWAHKYQIRPANLDFFKIGLILIDIQNSFCIPGFELFVSGRSGLGAVEDNRRLCNFIYSNLSVLTHITATLDTHSAVQIFHPIFIVDANGNHPHPHTLISYQDVKDGRWRFNPDIAPSIGIDPAEGQKHLLHYTKTLMERQKYDLTIWPYHVMLGSLGHAFVPAVEEAIFFHTIARKTQANFNIKGDNPLTEHYSAIGPEVLKGPHGKSLADKNRIFIRLVETHDAIIIAGQAKSHCVAWTIADLLKYISEFDQKMVRKVYLLEDCTSPVVVPGVVDYTSEADAAFERFKIAGMNIVQSTDPIDSWLDFSNPC